jgi:hypothetical protein
MQYKRRKWNNRVDVQRRMLTGNPNMSAMLRNQYIHTYNVYNLL